MSEEYHPSDEDIIAVQRACDGCDLLVDGYRGLVLRMVGALRGRGWRDPQEHESTIQAVYAANRERARIANDVATPAPAASVEVSEHAAMANGLAKRIEMGEWLATRVKLFETFASERVCKNVDAAMESRFGESHRRLLAAALAAAGK